MTEPNRNTWAQTHLRWLALSRWDNEGGRCESVSTNLGFGKSAVAPRLRAIGQHAPDEASCGEAARTQTSGASTHLP